ncbi:MAG: hypothetical protein ACRDY2_00310 [Acidimicrobiales bacterium]
MAEGARPVTDDTVAEARRGRERVGRRHPAGEVRILPPAYRPMTAEQEERAVEALAGLLADAEQPREQTRGRERPAP